MTTERREPTISAIRPERDEIVRAAQRQQAPQRGKAGQGVAQSGSRPVVVKSPLAPLALLLAFAGLGLAGFAYWELKQAQRQMLMAEARIQELESKLELSDDESSASLVAVQAKLKWADSEIRKLWGVSYDINKKAIAANKGNIASLSKTTKSIDKKVKTAIDGEIKPLAKVVDGYQSSISSIEQSHLRQQTQVQLLADQLNQLEALETELQQRVTSNEQAIEAIDAFRRSVNRELLQLKGGQ